MSIKECNAPIYLSIKQYLAKQPIAFHMPGHKLGKGIPASILKEIFMMDLTEIPGLDHLHFPKGSIKEAQDMASRAFMADRTFFLVNGSTCGNQAMIMAACKPGDRLIVSRDCHKSVISGMMLAGVRPVYIKPEYNEQFAISTTISTDEIEKALLQNSDVVGVLITRPNYYGICSDIKRIAEITHAHGKILMVDEAHGAHLGFHESLPLCAMQGGADICVQSAHKTLPALTQGAYLHVKSSKIDVDRLAFYLSILQTSSPSYLIMALLDIAREIMQENGNALLNELLKAIHAFEGDILSKTNLTLLKSKEGMQVDRTKIVLNMKNIGLTGFKAENLLRHQYGIQMEMSDFYNIVGITTVADNKEGLARLLDALVALDKEYRNTEPIRIENTRALRIPEQRIDLQNIAKYTGQNIPLDKAIGQVSMQMITPYPPGIPVICPGEIILEETVTYLQQLIAAGGMVNGLEEKGAIKVVKRKND